MKDRMRRQLREEKTKGDREHGTVRRDSRVGQMKITAQIEKKVSYFGNSKTGNRMAVRVAPGAIGGPLGLIVQSSGKAPGEGKLTSNSCREAEMARGSLAMRYPVSPSAQRFP